MKNIKKSSILKLLFTVVLCCFIVYSCGEEVQRPCNDEYTITILTKKVDCETGQCMYVAPYAQIVVSEQIGPDKYEDISDTLLTDENGRLFWKPDEPTCGAYLRFTGIYNTRHEFYGECFHKDATIILCFDDCPDTSEVSCDDLDLKCYRYFYNDDEDPCIYLNSRDTHIECCRFTNTGASDIEITSIASIKIGDPIFPGSKFIYHSITPPWDGTIPYLVPPLVSVKVCFKVSTDELGEFSDEIEIDLFCESNDSTGTWTINLEAEICPQNCCPYIPVEEVYVDHTKEPVLVDGSGNSQTFDPIEIFINDFSGGDCEICVTAIEHIDGPKYWELLDAPKGTPYPLGNPLTPPLRFIKGESFLVFPRFTPGEIGCHADTFRIVVEQCDGDTCGIYTLIIEGCGCVDECPVIEISDYWNEDDEGIRVEYVDINGITPISDIWDERNYSGFYEIITDSRDILLGSHYNNLQLFFRYSSDYAPPSDCFMDHFEFDELTFYLKYDYNVNYCDLKNNFRFKSINTGESDSEIDQKRFDFKPTVAQMDGKEDEIKITVRFIPPTSEEWNIEKPDGDSTYKFRLDVYDVVENCHIVLNFETKITGLPEISPIRQLYAFSQITTKQTIPDYMTVKIDAQHPDGHWGVDKNLNISQTKAGGNQPDTDDSFYINVEQPTNTTIVQTPTLHLVNTTGNSFDMISASPIANYATNDQFVADLGNQVNRVIHNTNCFLGNNIPSRSNTTFTGPTKGIGISSGNLFLVWNSGPPTYPDPPINNCVFPCHVAFIFIYEVSDGPVSVSDVANIRYRIVYPVIK